MISYLFNLPSAYPLYYFNLYHFLSNIKKEINNNNYKQHGIMGDIEIHKYCLRKVIQIYFLLLIFLMCFFIYIDINSSGVNAICTDRESGGKRGERLEQTSLR